MLTKQISQWHQAMYHRDTFNIMIQDKMGLEHIHVAVQCRSSHKTLPEWDKYWISALKLCK